MECSAVVSLQVLADLAAPVPMMRLLQGDVGSGKTAVAFLALLAAAGSGYQSVLMAPTEVCSPLLTCSLPDAQVLRQAEPAVGS